MPNVPFWGSANRGDWTNITQDTDRNSRAPTPQRADRYSFLAETSLFILYQTNIVPTKEKIQAHLVPSRYEMQLKLRIPTTDQNEWIILVNLSYQCIFRKFVTISGTLNKKIHISCDFQRSSTVEMMTAWKKELTWHPLVLCFGKLTLLQVWA